MQPSTAIYKLHFGTLTASFIPVAMEEIDLMNFEPVSAPMTLEAWIILAFMLGLEAWGFWAERRDLKR